MSSEPESDVKIKTYELRNESEYDQISASTGREVSLFIDSDIAPDFNSELTTFLIRFNRKININTFYIRELTVKTTEQSLEQLNQFPFLVCRVKQFKNSSNNILYDYSALNPDTDIIINKANYIDPFLTFEQKYIHNYMYDKKHYDSLTLQILDNKCNPINLQASIFLDIKIMSYGLFNLNK